MAELPDIQLSELSGGSRLAWREWGHGKPLIMLHGWSMSSVVFSEVAALLAEDYRLLCPDLPGHGFSDRIADCNMQTLNGAIEQWAGQLGLADVALLGWSLGGQVALQLAATTQGLIERLLLIATTPRFCQADDWAHGLPNAQVQALDRNLGRAYEKTMGDFFNLQFADEDLPKERYRQILKFAVRSGRLPQPETARELLQLLGRTDLRSELSKIKRPALVMHGELDQIIPIGAGEYLAEHLPAAQFCRLSKLGHAPFFSKREECVEHWRNFLP